VKVNNHTRYQYQIIKYNLKISCNYFKYFLGIKVYSTQVQNVPILTNAWHRSFKSLLGKVAVNVPKIIRNMKMN
jgi:hypothetical protein